jgi:hypothetical protein
MKLLYFLSFASAVYVVYMLRYFKTRYSLAHPLVKFKTEFLRHPIGVSSEPVSNICPFGHLGALLIAFALITRLIFVVNKLAPISQIKMYSRMAVFLIFIFSLMNMNAVVYLIPFFASEYYIHKLL